MGKSGIFEDNFSVQFGSEIIFKSPRFGLFGANLTHSHPKSLSRELRGQSTCDSLWPYRCVRFGSKVVKFVPKGEKSGTFSEKNLLISDLEKSRICPICDQSDPIGDKI